MNIAQQSQQLQEQKKLSHKEENKKYERIMQKIERYLMRLVKKGIIPQKHADLLLQIEPVFLIKVFPEIYLELIFFVERDLIQLQKASQFGWSIFQEALKVVRTRSQQRTLNFHITTTQYAVWRLSGAFHALVLQAGNSQDKEPLLEGRDKIFSMVNSLLGMIRDAEQRGRYSQKKLRVFLETWLASLK